jgi:phosphoglycolate phosphatase
MKKIKAVFFDFDGTVFKLATDWEEIRRRLKKIFRRYGLESDFKPLFGEINRLLEDLSNKGVIRSKITKIEKKIDQLIAEEEGRGIKEGELIEGVVDIFTTLKKKKMIIAILSRNSRKVVKRVIECFNLPQPDIIIGREDTGLKNLKPHPLAGMMALKQLGLKKEAVLFVGDSLNDWEFSQNFGVKAVLLKSSRLPFVPEKVELISNLSTLKRKINL